MEANTLQLTEKRGNACRVHCITLSTLSASVACNNTKTVLYGRTTYRLDEFTLVSLSPDAKHVMKRAGGAYVNAKGT